MAPIHIQSGTIDLRQAVVRIDGLEHQLTPLEVRFLERMVATPGVVVSYDVLLREVWEAAPQVQTRAVEALVARLRKKIGEDSRRPVHLRTVHGLGLVWEAGAPPAPTGWVGRSAERNRIMPLLCGPGLVTIVGLPGSGKTHLARLVAPSAPVVVARKDLIEAISEALGLLPAVANDRDQVLEQVRARQVLILDGLDPDNTDVDILAALARLTAVVVTSSRPVGVPGEQLVRLGPLAPDDCRTLLRSRLDAEGASVPPHDLERVASTLDGYPLEIEVVAGALAVVGPAVLDSVSRLDLTKDGPAPRSLRWAFARAWSAVPQEDVALMGALTWFERDFDLEAAAEVSGVPVAAALSALQRQVRRAWVTTPTHGWFRLPGSVRAFVAEVCAEPRAAASSRWVSFCARLERGTLIEGVGRAERFLDDLLAASRLAEGSELLAVAVALREIAERRPASARVLPALRSAVGRTAPPLRDTLLGLRVALSYSLAEDSREPWDELLARRAAGSTDPVLLRALIPIVPPEQIPELIATARRSVATSPEPIRLRYQASLAALAGGGAAEMVEIGRYAREQGLHHLAKLARLGEGRALFLAGQWVEATAVFSETDDEGVVEAGVGLEAAICTLWTGDPAGALRILDVFSARLGPTGYGAIALAARAVVLHGTGEVEEARRVAHGLQLSDRVPMKSLLPLVNLERGAPSPPLRDQLLEDVRLAWLAGRNDPQPLRATTSVLLRWWLRANGAPSAGG